MHELDIHHNNRSLQEKLKHLYSLRTGSKVNWDRTEYLKLLHAFGDPHTKLPPVIHVAGTNGKGSIVATLKSIYEAQGFRVHTYTSPHLITVNERIYLAGKNITDEVLEQKIDQAIGFIGKTPLSFFEIMTAIAFSLFSEIPADMLLLEVGCGGRLDCTNVIANPAATVISRISMDHTEFLGDTISKIAAEKAGIMKRNVPCVTSYQGQEPFKSEIDKTLKIAAEEKGASLVRYGEEWNIEIHNQKIHFSFEETTNSYTPPNLLGMHQIWNVGAALAVIKLLQDKFLVTEEAINIGISHIFWPGRLQQLPVYKFGLSETTEIWLDSGHNDSAGEVLAEQIEIWDKTSPKPLHLIVGMLGTKDIGKFLSPLVPLAKSVCIVPIEGEKNSKTLNDVTQALPPTVNTNKIGACDNYNTAIKQIQKKSLNARILIAGSVYLAGNVLKS